MNNKQVGTFIAERRKALGLTQVDLAEKMGVTDKAVSKWERGLSFPDITSIPTLAEELQVSVGELIEGRSLEEEKISLKTLNDATIRMMTYAGKLNEKTKRLIYWLVAGSLALAVIISLICNLAISKSIDWSLYVVGGAVTAAATIFPLLILKRHRLAFSLLLLNITAIPYLALIQWLAPGGGWFVPLALPFVVVLDVSVLTLFWLFKTFWNRMFYCFAGVFALTALVTAVSNLYADYYLTTIHVVSENRYWWISVVASVAGAIICALIGYISDRKDSGQDVSS